MSARLVLILCSLALIGFHLWTAFFGVIESFAQRNVHLLLVVFCIAASAWTGEARRKWAVTLASAALAGPLIYNIWTAEHWANHMAYVIPLDTLSIGLALVGMAGLFAIAVLLMGWAFGIIIAVFGVYLVLGTHAPGIFQHRGFGMSWAVDHLFYTKEGVFGIPLGVSATYIILFILFGAMLDRLGGGKFMIDLAMALTGRLRGGPAKAAIVGSSLMGTISGSAVANVVTTGAITIPLMKRNGYKPHFAGAVEAAASSGGQLMPPVMGATAFVIAEFVGRPYAEIALAALIPALLFYLGIFAAVHFEAVRTGIKTGVESPRLRQTFAEGALYLLPIAVVAWAVFTYSPMRAALYGAWAVLAVALVYGLMRGGLGRLPGLLLDGVVSAASAIGPVAVACAASGIIIGILSLTGLGLAVNNSILKLAGQSLPAALVLTMISSLILGMGLPTVAAYLVQAGVTIPALIQLGVEPIPAHLFVFYFAILGNVTPPVAVAAYAAAGISGADPAKTGWRAAAISLPAFIVPFMFVLDPVILLQGAPLAVAASILTAVIGVVALAGAVVGCVFTRLDWLSRGLMGLGALLMLYPGLASDAGGAALIAGGLIWGTLQARGLKENKV